MLRQGVSGRNGAGQEAATQRRVGDEADAEFVGEWKNLLFDVAGP
jgi:hypothetical protein